MSTTKNYFEEYQNVSNTTGTLEAENKIGIPINKARQLLGKTAQNVSDSIIEKLLQFCELIGNYIIENFLAGKFK